LSAATLATEQYASLFGMPPNNRIVIVQGDFPDGMEFSGLAYVSTNWFYAFDGGVQNFLTMITVHEVAHQWWYAKVGNDAAYDPWLDEALSTYSEYIYVEEFYPQFREWWWSFRVAWYNPQGDVDSDVYEFDSGRGYINAVYLRGVQMLHNIREDIGTEEFFDLLAAYAQAGDGQIATPELFWSLLTPEQMEATAATREEFLREPDVIPEPIGGGR
jgi:aminopeptidase N